MSILRSSFGQVRIALFVVAVGAASFACGGPGAAPAASPGPATEGTGTAKPGAPGITHELAGRDDCLSCHVLGAKPPKGLAESHKGRDNSMCRGCHQPAVANAGT
jgi:hypothetical protein